MAPITATGSMTARVPVGGDGSPLRRIWRIARPAPVRLWAATLLAAGALTSSVGLLVVSAWLISRASQQPPILYLQVAIVSVRALGISRGVLRYAERVVGHDAALRSLTEVRVAVYGRLERLAPAGLGRHRRGDLLARMVGDVDSTTDLVVRVIVPALASLVAGLVAVGIGWSLVPAAGLALLGAVIVGGLVAPALSVAVGARAQAGRAHAEGVLSSELVTSLEAAAELRAFGVVEDALDRIATADHRLTTLDRRSALAGGLGEGLSVVATGLCLVACLWLGASAVPAGTLDGVWLAALVLLPLALTDVLSGTIPAALARARVAGAARRIVEVIDAPDPVPTVAPEAPAAARTTTGHHHAAVLDRLSAGYPGSLSDALADLDLDLSAGRRIALVGPSGSGKSTAVAVLVRLLDHRAGDYHLDGTDVRELPEEQVRLVVGALDQHAHLFDSTIEENLLLANRDATAAQLQDALDGAELSGWVAELPAGLHTRVGVGGSHVSGGEAQRIALARLLLADRSVALLDEPGEHLDVAAADRVTRAALEAVAGRTVLLVTHRMSHTQQCDEVVVLDDSRVVARGAPGELGGWYADALAREQGPSVGGPAAAGEVSSSW
jgi:ATP-binding cassette subfamily C protein CydCD